ncbi:Dehydrogenase (flavoprotein) [Nakamurella panacisegetis]|uniref:Dehydrogenase (Flavoprotein) n=1 Tax=Nakamurella panacisegetis TaxID=1090615 RepID=A0A1H0KGU1_9ACTN|nr:NAD(P)/FAD-dependent oxidoreductase [Nakamurella panacisegetis]SDO54922.1 Dehydrogenase (flavoprotein) [Nakamurella panacisegetis]
MIDLLVAGAGPAGLATALYAARAGLSVTVVDPRTGPIDKACGEGLMPGAVRALNDLGVVLSGQAFGGIRYLDARRSAAALFPHGAGLGVRRTALHEAMTTRAVAAGVRFAVGTVTDVSQGHDTVTAAGHQARYLVAADGLHSPVRHQLGLNRPARGPARWGQRQHFSVASSANLVEVHWAARSECYVTPIGPGEIGVAVLSSRRAPFAVQLEAFPRVLEALRGATPTTVVRGAGPLRQNASRRALNRVLLVGDAAGYVDALTGEGIAVSLACARSAVAAIVADRPTDYERAWRRDTRRYRWITETLLTTRRFAGRSIVPAASLLPDVFRLAVGQLAR